MKKQVYVSLSTLPVKEYQKIVDYAAFMQDKADFLHCDVMDGKFVEGKTYDWQFLAGINKGSLIMLDVHLMTANPQETYQNYIDSGANVLSLHYEAVKDKEKLACTIKDIQSQGVLAGLAINPGTSFREVKSFLYDIDVVLVLCVEPGASGQKLLPNCIEKIKQIDRFRSDNNLNFKIEADGGVNESNAKALVSAGADILVSGNFVYSSTNKTKAIEVLKSAAK